MSQDANGENLSVEERLEKFERVISDYSNSVGLDKIIYNKEVDEVLYYSESQIKNLDREGCKEKAFLLSQYAATLQRETNKQNIRLNWAEKELDRLVAKLYSNYSSSTYDKYEVVKGRILNGDSTAAALYTIIQNADARKTELTSMAYRVESMGAILKSLGDSR